jgi:hypothetical protein
MVTLRHKINNVPQFDHGPYHDRDDALRQAHEYWVLLPKNLPRGAVIDFELVDEAGHIMQSHAAILEEIERRVELRQTPRIR